MATDMETAHTPSSLRELIEIAMAGPNSRPVFIWGPPGIGKSDIVHQIGEDWGVEDVLDIRLLLLEPTDLRGIPYRDPDSNTMQWSQPGELPPSNTDSRYIIFLDELTAAPQSVQAAAYQLVLDRKVGTYDLPPNAMIVAAGNRVKDNGVAHKMPTPLANRFIHFTLDTNFNDWLEWAVNNRVHSDVIGFLGQFKNKLNQFDPKSQDVAFATPRSWKYVSDKLYSAEQLGKTNGDTVRSLVAGCVGEGIATEFVQHREVAHKLPSPSDVLDGKVKDAQLDKQSEISAQYAITASLCYELSDRYKATDQNDKEQNKKFHESVDNFFGFLMNNLRKELVIMAIRQALKNYKIQFSMKKLNNWSEFYKKYGSLVSDAL